MVIAEYQTEKEEKVSKKLTNVNLTIYLQDNDKLNLQMNENYISRVRQSLYNNLNNQTVSSEKGIQIKSKIQITQTKFGPHAAFLPKALNKPEATGKMKKSIRNKNEDYGVFVKCDKNISKKRNPKKKVNKSQIKISLTVFPSTSETSDFPCSTIENVSRKKKKLSKTTEEYESDKHFDLNTYFSSREQSFNESIIEPHSGIDYEFLNSATSNTKINSSKIYENSKMKREKLKKSPYNTHDLKTSINNIDSDYENNEQQPEANICENISGTEEIASSSNISVPYSEEVLDQNDVFEESLDPTSVGYRTDYTYFDREQFKFVILEKNQSVSCYGLCLLKVLYGKLDVLGYTLERGQEVSFYSPRGSSLLLLTNVTKEKSNSSTERIKNTLNEISCLKDVNIETTSVVFLCTKVNHYNIVFVEKYISQQIFPKMDSPISPQIILNPKEKFNVININPEWEIIINSATAMTKLLIIGGKGVGKSTFMRYSINRLLTKFKKIRVVDLDPGQSEFFLPGCISIFTLTEPVLGPNYTHLQKPERSYLSNINVGHNPKKYIECIKTLMGTLNQKDNLPTVVNYMGFVQNIGINIVSAAITLIKPTDVVQIDSRNYKKNFKIDVTPMNVLENCDLFGGDSTASKTLDFNFVKISAMSDDNCGWTLEPRQVRDMCVLSYFGKLMNEDTDCLSSPNIPVYKIGLSSISIVDDQGNKIPAAAVNANLVALGRNIENRDMFNVAGYGVVRGIDAISKTLYLITPEPFDELKNISYLILTSVSLPPSIYMTSKDVGGCIPYVMDGELEALGQITKRSYVPTNKK